MRVKNKNKARYIPISSKVPGVVYTAMQKRIDHAKADYPSFGVSELIRFSLVYYLKAKGYLRPEVQYL